jgi:hypothetical protein
MRLRVDLDHDVDIAAGPVFAPGHRAEQGSTPRARSACSERRKVSRASWLFTVQI